MRRSLWAIGLLIFIVGCIRPLYERPCVDSPPHWRLEADEGSTLCNFRWWELFEDPVLNDLILVALENNQDLQVAIYRVFEYYAKLGIRNSDLYPTITGQFDYDRIRTSRTIPAALPPRFTTSNNFDLFFNGTWEFDLWGRIACAVEGSYYDLLSQVEARRGVVMTVVSSVANAYINLRALDAQLEISKMTLASRLQSLQLAKDRFTLGETSELEVKQEESEVETAAIRVLEFERDIPIQENLLSILVGWNPGPIERGKTIDAFHHPMTVPSGLPIDLLTRRPDIVQAEDNLIAANARLAEARLRYFPDITLTGQYGSQSDSLRKFLSSPSEMWQYGVELVQTLFDAGRIYFGVEERKADFLEALYSYYQTILTALQEVNDGLVAFKMNERLVEEHERQVKVLGEYVHLARLRYEEGEVDYLNVLDAERELFNGQLDYVQAQADNFTAVVQLYKALGGGWVDDADSIAVSEALRGED